MEGTEHRSRYGRIVFDDTGIEIIEPGVSVLFVPWYAVGHIDPEHDVGRARLVRMHLADGRTVMLPAPVSDRVAAAGILRAWIGYSKTRLREPHDEIPPEFRAAAARSLDPIHDDAGPANRPDVDDIQDSVPSAGRSFLRRRARRR